MRKTKMMDAVLSGSVEWAQARNPRSLRKLRSAALSG